MRRRLANAVLSHPTNATTHATNLYDLQWLAQLCVKYWPEWLASVDQYRQRLLHLITTNPTVANIDTLIPVERLFDQMHQVRKTSIIESAISFS